MKSVCQSALIVILAALASCNRDNSAELARDAKISALEKRVSELESQTQRSVQQENSRRVDLRKCLTEADISSQESLRDNALNPRSSRLSIPTAVMNEIAKIKQQKMEECKMLYGN